MSAWGCEQCAKARGIDRWGPHDFSSRDTFSSRASAPSGYCGLGNHRVAERIEYFANEKASAVSPPPKAEIPKGPPGEQLGLF
jgi:hypothetical protein